MADEKEKSLEEWMAEEKARLKKGFTYEPPPSSGKRPDPAEEILTGLGLGAGVVAAGGIGPHPNPVTFEGVKAAVMANALQQDLSDDDTRVEVSRADDSLVVTFLVHPTDAPYAFSPALTATLIEKEDALTITLGQLNPDAKRDALTSAGSTLLKEGARVLTGGGGVAGLLNSAGNVIEGVDNLLEDVEDLKLPQRVWDVVDRVGSAAQLAFQEQRRKERELEEARKEVERQWTHCPSCGRAYRADEAERVDCPTCGGPRGEKPAWLT